MVVWRLGGGGYGRAVETTLESTRRSGLRRRLLRLLPLAVVALGFAVVLASGVWRHLSLAELGARRAALKGFVQVHPAESLALYVLAYCAVVAFSIPGALLMTLTGGFLFGTWIGGRRGDGGRLQRRGDHVPGGAYCPR